MIHALKLFFGAIAALLISLLRFLLSLLYTGFRLVDMICVFFLTQIENLLHEIK